MENPLGFANSALYYSLRDLRVHGLWLKRGGVCKKVLHLTLDLISPRNIEDVVQLLKREVVKTQDKTLDKSAEYRHLDNGIKYAVFKAVRAHTVNVYFKL